MTSSLMADLESLTIPTFD